MKKMKRVTAGFLAATLVLGNSMDAVAASGYGQFHNAVTLPFAERTFASDAQSQIDADMGLNKAGYWGGHRPCRRNDQYPAKLQCPLSLIHI